MGKHAQSIDSQILQRVKTRGRGWVFTASNFVDLGSRDAVDKTLSRQSQAGIIRKLARGIYDYPGKDPQLGLLSPSIDAIAKALRGRDAIRLQPAGGYAANLLGLSDQVPAKIVFLTDGTPRWIQIGKLQIILKRTTPRNMMTAGKISGLVIQALRHLGQRHVDDRVLKILRRRLSAADKRQILKNFRYALGMDCQVHATGRRYGAWMHIVRRNCGGGSRTVILQQPVRKLVGSNLSQPVTEKLSRQPDLSTDSGLFPFSAFRFQPLPYDSRQSA